MNILQLAITKSWGGGGLQMENLCYEMLRLDPGVNITFFCSKNSILHQRLKKSRFNYIAAPLKTKIDPRFIYKLIKTCRSEKIDLVHIHGPSALMVAIIADKIGNLPVFVFSKKTSFPIKTRKRTLYKYNYHKIKKIICVSRQVKTIAAKAIKDKSKLIIVHDGLRFDALSPEAPFLLRDKFNIDPGKKIIGNIANHIEAKDLDTWINVINNIVNVEKRTGFHFIQIGTFSKLTPTIKDKIKQLKLEKYISFLGYKENASNFIPQFDIFLLTSKSEGLSLVIYECFYHKTPVVSTKVGIVPEIIENGKNGLLAEVKDDIALAKHILDLNGNKKQIQQFTALSFKKLVPDFSAETMAKNTLNVYKEVLNDCK